jgi:hypothetical protein
MDPKDDRDEKWIVDGGWMRDNNGVGGNFEKIRVKLLVRVETELAKSTINSRVDLVQKMG